MTNQSNIKTIKLYCGNIIIKVKKPNMLGNTIILKNFAITIKKANVKSKVKRYIVNDNLTNYLEYNKEVSITKKVVIVRKIPVLHKDDSFDLPLDKIEIIQK